MNVVQANRIKTDQIILAFCMLCILICVYLLLNIDKFFRTERSNEAVIGNLTAISADVRHKSKSDYFWRTSKLANKISQGDSVFTGEKSSSVVTLKDGEKLQISQNSLVHFSGNKNRLQINLAFGNIKTSGLEKPLFVTDCGQKYLIESTQAQFELSKSDRCGSFQLQVKTGAVQVTKYKIKKIFKNTETRKISLTDSFTASTTSQKLVVPLTAPPVVIAPPVAVIPPPAVIAPPLPIAIVKPMLKLIRPARLSTPQFLEPLQTVTLAKNTKVPLTWKPVPGAKSYRLDIADNEKFSQATAIQLKTNAYDFVPPTSGDFYFRTQAFANGYNPSYYSNPAVIKTEFPSIQVDQTKFIDTHKARSPADSGQAKKYPLNWNAIPTAEKYVIEVDKNISFTNPTQSEVNSPTGYAEVPRTGNYYFRVSAVDKTGRRISSMPSMGEIIYKKMNQIGGPLIENAYKSLSFYFQKEYGQFIWLRWKSNLQNNRFRVEVAKSKDFKKINFTFATDQTKVLIKSKVPKGDYFWRVRSESPDNISAWSEISELKVRTK